ncbi:hypothetical protein BN59_02327 [Legionella massiliensis]|uniref:Uncharacterized protein n=1 Tax=Legionella massiliensis TaxID=1034943 RepID=A0A078KUA4_9GAMM|nr:hypothetical protein [Legionella massiliensis]CDZ78030.1 hypothetical protein BN59_02327 [Legionella massiliensis]CEE13768.1 hypothetical protein BN1094_02327 [Legionella massiliensis]
MGKRSEKILKPKLSGLAGKDKPLAFIVQSPHDRNNPDPTLRNAVKFLPTKTFVGDLGFGMLNKAAIEFSESTGASFKKVIKPGPMKPQITVWFEAHGAPGWLFGADKSQASEFEGTVQFVGFIHALEAYLNTEVNHIVLSGCYTGCEFNNGSDYFISPARMLSILLPGKEIVGFIGQHAKGKVSHVYSYSEGFGYEERRVNPEEASIVFQDGMAIESLSKKELYCDHGYTPEFILEGCHLDPELDASDYYLPCAVLEEMQEKQLEAAPDSYGATQERQARDFVEAHPELLERAPQPARGPR